MGSSDIDRSIRSSSSFARAARPVRVSAERVFELARHLTERDREIAIVLFEQQVLTTDQLTLLFFSSKRRAQDRLLFLYRHRVLDRFYPPTRFGSGKPQAHWLLDEAGAILMAAQLGVERGKLGLAAPRRLGLTSPARAPAGKQPLRNGPDRRNTRGAIAWSGLVGRTEGGGAAAERGRASAFAAAGRRLRARLPGRVDRVLPGVGSRYRDAAASARQVARLSAGA
jgi:hypothetical protein